MRRHASRHLLVVGLGGGEVGHAAGAGRALQGEPLGERALAAARAAQHKDESSRVFG
jgi:hypothetical protein